MKDSFFNKGFWRDATGATLGTIIGIILTFGTTFYFENRAKDEMARKTVKITLHNLDVQIKNMKKESDFINQKDSIYKLVAAHMPDSLCLLPDTTLIKFLRSFNYKYIMMTDNVPKKIFSHSFDVWKYLDDEKVIGRISSCYSMLEFHNSSYKELEERSINAYLAWRNQIRGEEAFGSIAEEAKSIMYVPEIQQVIMIHSQYAVFLKQLADITKQLNERNKEAIGLTQDELDEVGNLMEKNNYDIGDGTDGL